MDDVQVQDLIAYAYDQKPIEFQNSFNDLMASRLTAAIDAKKIEVAQNIFTNEEESELEPTDQEEPEDDTVA
jgi:hypothetical protein